MPGDALDVFISYSHEDKTLRQELEERLVRLRREGLVRTWHERQITPGGEWRGWIAGDLVASDLILLIVSAPFLASGYCQGTELKCALERRAWGHAEILPIIARPCDWRSAPFGGMTTLPQGVGPVTEWHSRDNAWDDVVSGIREAADRLRAARDAATMASGAPGETDRRAESPPEKAPEAGTPRWTILGAFAAALATLAAVLYFAVWQPRSVEHATPPVQASEARSPRDEAGRPSPATAGPRAARATEQPSAPPPPEATRAETEPDVAEVTPRQAPPAVLPEEEPPPEAVTAPEELAPVAAEAAAEPAEPATAVADEQVGSPEPVVELQKLEDFERSLGILAVPGAETEGDCVAVLVADDYALTSRACAQAAGIVVMGGNALTATRDEIFDLEPGQSLRPADVSLVKLIRGLGESWGFVSTRLEKSFDYARLDAHYVASSAIRRVECVAEARLPKRNDGGHAYVEDATFDRYVRFVEAAAAEAIAIAGSRWAELLAEVLGSSEESPAGFVCGLPDPPPRNLVFSVGGSVVGIGYSCEPFDRLEPEVRDRLPPEIRGLDLDCIASLGEIREDLRDVQARTDLTEVSD